MEIFRINVFTTTKQIKKSPKSSLTVLVTTYWSGLGQRYEHRRLGKGLRSVADSGLRRFWSKGRFMTDSPRFILDHEGLKIVGGQVLRGLDFSSEDPPGRMIEGCLLACRGPTSCFGGLLFVVHNGIRVYHQTSPNAKHWAHQ